MSEQQEKKEESPSTSQLQPTNTGKLQRKLKFKTLDGNIKNLECDYDIKISELKKKLAEIYKIEPIRQRLLYRGKQFKDEETLDKLVDQDDTIIHLVFRSEADVRQMQENAQNNNSNENQNQNNQNVNPFQNILNIVNSDQLRNLTNNIVNQIFSNQNNNSNNNNNTIARSNQTSTINIGTTQYQTLNIGEALNLTNSPLHPIAQPPNLTNPPPLNLNENNSNNQNINNENNSNINNQNVNKNNYSSQFPITPSNSDKKYEVHLKNIEKELNSADELISQKMDSRIPLPLLNTTQNVFTAISRSIRKYVIVNQNILCHLMRLAEIMEREQFITNSETRMTGNKLLDQAYKSLLHIAKASNDLSNVIKSSNFNTAPNTGYIGIVCQGVGIETTSVPIGVGEINTENILAALGGVNNNSGINNNSNNNNSANIILTNITNNSNQIQGNNQVLNTSIPLGIVEVTVDASEVNNNTNNNINNNINISSSNNIQNVNSTSSANTTKIEQKDTTEKKVEDSKLNEKKEKKQENKNEAKNDNINLKSSNTNKKDNSQNSKDINQKIEINNNSKSNQNVNPATTVNNSKNTQNTNSSTNQNNTFNLFGNMMNQLMTPENMNSLMGTINNSLNPAANQSGGNSQNSGGFLGNLFSNLMGAFGDESDEEDDFIIPSSQQVENQPKKEFITPKDNQPQNANNNTNNNAINKNSLIKKLVESPQLRRETKISDESKIGEKIDPNIEFASFSNEIISNLTVQEIFNMYNLHFTGLSRLRKDIQKKYFLDKSKNEEKKNQIIGLLCERFILIENEIDKLIDNKEFIIEDFLNKYLKEILNMFIEDNEVNKNDSEWENKFRKLVINMIISLINEVKEVYESEEEGARAFIEYNITSLIENFVGQKYLSLLENYDKDIFKKFIENLFTIVKTEQIKNRSNNNNESPYLLSIDEIFHMASKDKEILEKEEKERSENEINKRFSDFYQLTSLFKK